MQTVIAQCQQWFPHSPTEGLILACPQASVPLLTHFVAPGSELGDSFLADPLTGPVAVIRDDPVSSQHTTSSTSIPGAQLEPGDAGGNV